jgi:hypothetical protein
MTCEPEIWNVLFVPGTSFPDLLVVITLHRGPITIKPVRAATSTQVKEQRGPSVLITPSLISTGNIAPICGQKYHSTHLSRENTYPNDPPSLSNAEYALFSKMQSWPRVTFDQLITRRPGRSGKEMKGGKCRRDKERGGEGGSYQPTIIHQSLKHPRPKKTYRKGSEGGLTNKRSSDRSTRSYSTRQPIEVQPGVGNIGLCIPNQSFHCRFPSLGQANNTITQRAVEAD